MFPDFPEKRFQMIDGPYLSHVFNRCTGEMLYISKASLAFYSKKQGKIRFADLYNIITHPSAQTAVYSSVKIK